MDELGTGQWRGPNGLRVRVVRLTGVHRLLATGAGVPNEVVATVLVTRGGAFVGRGYYASLEELAADIDLSELVPE